MCCCFSQVRYVDTLAAAPIHASSGMSDELLFPFSPGTETCAECAAVFHRSDIDILAAKTSRGT